MLVNNDEREYNIDAPNIRGLWQDVGMERERIFNDTVRRGDCDAYRLRFPFNEDHNKFFWVEHFSYVLEMAYHKHMRTVETVDGPIEIAMYEFDE